MFVVIYVVISICFLILLGLVCHHNIVEEQVEELTMVLLICFLCILASIFWPLTVIAVVCATMITQYLINVRKQSRSIYIKLMDDMYVEDFTVERREINLKQIKNNFNKLSNKEIQILTISNDMDLHYLPFVDRNYADTLRKILSDEIAERELLK